MRENVVLIILDDMPPAAWEKMSNLMSRPDGKWVRFTKGVNHVAECRPSRATTFTGQYISNHGVTENNTSLAAWIAANDHHTIFKWLKDRGYSTAMIGKCLNGYPWGQPEGWAYRLPGVDFWWTGNSVKYFDYDLSNNGVFAHRALQDGWIDPACVGFTPEARLARAGATDFVTDRINVESRNWVFAAQEPFFCYVAHISPHDAPDGSGPGISARHAGMDWPVVHPPNFNADVSDKPAWLRDQAPANEPWVDWHLNQTWQSVQAVDEAIYDLMKSVKDRGGGVFDRTIWIIAGDNGFQHAEHRWVSKWSAYEPSIRTDVWVRHPALSASRDDEALVCNIDFAPTLCGIAGARPTRRPDGMDLMPRIMDPSAAWREAVLISKLSNESSLAPNYHGLVSADRKYVELFPFETHPAEAERYDLENDPWEMENLGLNLAFARDLAALLSG